MIIPKGMYKKMTEPVKDTVGQAVSDTRVDELVGGWLYRIWEHADTRLSFEEYKEEVLNTE